MQKKQKTEDRKTNIFHRIVEYVPVILLDFCLLAWFVDLLFSDLATFSLYKPDLILIFLVIAGFSLVARNLGIKIDDGIVFKKPDISPKFVQEKDNFVNEINEAKAKREKVIEEMRSRLDQNKRDEKIRRSIGLHKGEIQNLLYLKSEIEKRYNEIMSEIIDGVTFEDFSMYHTLKKEGERHVKEFENGTILAQKILDELKNGHEWKRIGCN